MATPLRKPTKAPKLSPAIEKVAPAAAAVVETAAANAEEALEAVAGGANEVKEALRLTTERTLEQTRAAYERMKSAAEEATGAIEATCTKASQGAAEFSALAIEAFKANADAQFDFLKALLVVKSPSEALALQNEFLRSRFEAVKAQATDLAGAAQKVAKDAAEPLKSTFGKGFTLAA